MKRPQAKLYSRELLHDLTAMSNRKQLKNSLMKLLEVDFAKLDCGELMDMFVRVTTVLSMPLLERRTQTSHGLIFKVGLRLLWHSDG